VSFQDYRDPLLAASITFLIASTIFLFFFAVNAYDNIQTLQAQNTDLGALVVNLQAQNTQLNAKLQNLTMKYDHYSLSNCVEVNPSQLYKYSNINYTILVMFDSSLGTFAPLICSFEVK